MRLIGIFLWIIFGAIILWFFTLNLSQSVDLNFFNYVMADVNLVTVIFVSIFIGVVLGSLLLVFQIIKVKTQFGRIKKEYQRVLKERDNLLDTAMNKNSAMGPEDNEV